MESLIILAGWIVAVAIVNMAVVRPWKTPAARAPLPVFLGVILAAWVIATGYFSYRQLMADGAWTGATIAIAFVPVKAIAISLIAYAAGRTFRTARASGIPQNWTLPVFLGLIVSYSVVSDVVSLRASALERHAANPALTTAEVMALTQRVREGDAGRSEIYAFLGNPHCPAELLTEYSISPDSYWRAAVARNEKIDEALAEKLAGDPDEQVRFYLAFNRKLSPAILSRLAADSSESVRDTVAWTDALPDDDFNRLVEDVSPKVRATTALQERLSPEQLEKLRNDPERRVRDAATRWGARTE
jgi:hypothetical protein